MTPGKDRRFEVTYGDVHDGKRKVFGWASTPEGVEALCNSVRLNPGMEHPLVRDCEQSPDPAPAVAPAGGVLRKRSYEETE